MCQTIPQVARSPTPRYARPISLRDRRGATPMSEQLRNWAGNITYHAARVNHPETVAQVQALVRRGGKLRVLGSRHSFNTIADTTGHLLTLDCLDPAPRFDHARRTITVGAGITYGHLGPLLHRHGYALHNLASLPHITVAGACATATHGSGDGNGNLATAVAAMEFVTADGEIVTLSREQHGDDFLGAVVALGGLGVVTRLTLDLVPTFTVRQDVYERLPFTQMETHFDAIMASGYSVSLFTDWQHEWVDQVWVKRRVETGNGDAAMANAAPEWFGATPAPAERHPLVGHPAVSCTLQMGVAGPWHERLPHFRTAFTPSSGEELQSEYFLPRAHAVTAFRALHSLREALAPLLRVSEVRTVAADHLWMSPCDGRDCVALHFTWRPDWSGVREVLPQIEAALVPLGATPHWGKLHTMPVAQVQAGFPKLAAFRQLLRTYDPGGMFRNAFLDRYVYGME